MLKYLRKLLWLSCQWMMTNRIPHLYFHIPFCSSICHYCDFCHVVYDRKLALDYLEKIKAELAEYDGNAFDTIYIGGGTPTALDHDLFACLLDLIKPFADSAKEITIEANPENLDDEKIDMIVGSGINRISLGLQSINNELLKLMNRKHRAFDFANTVHKLKQKGLGNISIDLMYSLPKQTMEMLKESLEFVVGLDVPHISIYSLTIEENSVFGKLGYQSLDEDTEADMYEYIISYLQNEGYDHYETSNFARNGHYSLHNIGYWDYDDFLGIGAGAASKIKSHRYCNTRNIRKYIAEEKAYDEELTLSVEDQEFENIMMSLRMKRGLDLKLFYERYNCNFLEKYKEEIAMDDLLACKDGHLFCTNGNILNEVLLRFIKD